MATVRGGTVLRHVKAFADACGEATGAESFGTYPGHSPSIDRALDIFVPTTSSTLGNAICAFAINNQERYGVRYVIYRQSIWHRQDPTWRAMEDRGDLTQNHYDHVHISFEATAADVPAPKPVPPTDKEMFSMVVQLVCEGEDWLYDSPGRIMYRITAPIWDVLKACKVPRVEVDRATLTEFQNVASNAGFTG